MRLGAESHQRMIGDLLCNKQRTQVTYVEPRSPSELHDRQFACGNKVVDRTDTDAESLGRFCHIEQQAVLSRELLLQMIPVCGALGRIALSPSALSLHGPNLEAAPCDSRLSTANAGA